MYWIWHKKLDLKKDIVLANFKKTPSIYGVKIYNSHRFGNNISKVKFWVIHIDYVKEIRRNSWKRYSPLVENNQCYQRT